MIFKKEFISILFFSIMATTAGAENYSQLRQTLTYRTGDLSAQNYDIGYTVSDTRISGDYFLYSDVSRLFTTTPIAVRSPYTWASVRGTRALPPMPNTDGVIRSNAFLVASAHVINMIATYIDRFEPHTALIYDRFNSRGRRYGREVTVSPEDVNRLSNQDLAAHIVQSSLCFGSDPVVIAGLIRKESIFSQIAVSHTGARGLTQMTDDGIDEVNDQLGNRSGMRGVPTDNFEALAPMIRCYMGTGWRQMWDDLPNLHRLHVRTNPSLNNPAKTWLMADIRRQIVYAQVLMKVHLGRYYSPSRIPSEQYRLALRAYNASSVRASYARAIFEYASYMHTSIGLANNLLSTYPETALAARQDPSVVLTARPSPEI